MDGWMEEKRAKVGGVGRPIDNTHEEGDVTADACDGMRIDRVNATSLEFAERQGDS